MHVVRRQEGERALGGENVWAPRSWLSSATTTSHHLGQVDTSHAPGIVGITSTSTSIWIKRFSAYRTTWKAPSHAGPHARPPT